MGNSVDVEERPSREPLDAGLEALLKVALDAVVIIDTSDRVIGWNGGATKSFGWSSEEAIGRRLSDLIIPQQHREAHLRGMRHYLETGDGPVLDHLIEISAVDRSGDEFPIELSITCTERFGERLFIGFLRDISQRRERTERMQRRLQESDHRVKNMLTVVAAIAQQTARNSKDLDEFEEAFSSRLQSLAKAHQLLVSSVWNDVAFSVLAEQVLSADVESGRARFGGPELLLGPRQVLGLSMILHELYTNAVKYGALCSDEGDITLEWNVVDEQVEMVWSETGPPCEHSDVSSGFGERMIAMSMRSDLDGTIERDWRPEGLKAILRFPLNN
ncbi:MAG TPA: HWE histidine kinase domain-containing protein [Sphingomicrobium sp.]|jgi:PAS domain S-box-containing protein|nr:HWE histidine kinase domain-containing protein [Sphingomicrobium sp.]